MALKLTDIASLETYFTALAIGAASHKEIDGIKFGDEEIVQTDNRSDMPARFLWVTEYEKWTLQDQNRDNFMKNKPFKIAYLKLADSETFANRQKAKKECEAVIMQIIAKMILDKYAGEILTRMDTWNAEVGEYTIGSTKYCGCELNISFMDNGGFEYDATKWN